MEKIEMESVARVLDQGKEQINQLKVQLHGLIKSEEDGCYILLNKVASSIDHALEKLGRMPLSVSNELGLTNSTTGGDNDKVQRLTDKKRKALPTRSVPGKETKGLPDDGFQWRKCGQKKILNAKHPREYYRCKNSFTKQCPAKKHVQKIDDASRVLDIKYLGSHTCEQEKPKKHKKNSILYTKQEDQWQPDPVDELLRNDLRDSEKKPLIPNFPYRVPPASDLVPEAGGSDSRMEIRDLNDGIKNIMLESGELKLESKELLQTGNSDKHEGKVEDHKDVKHDHNDYIPRSYSHGPLPRVLDTGRDSSRVEGKPQNDAHEAVGENRDEIKGDDKLKEKDRRRKEVKNWEWGDRDKERSDQRSSLQLPNISGENKDVLREERKPERGVSDEKEQQKDRDKLTEKEKDPVKKETWSVPDKEASISDRRLGEIPRKNVDTENSVPESMKDSDTFKNLEREPRDKKKERDADVEPERSEKRARIHERESDEGGVEGVVERERDVFNSGVAQRKRMLRPRSSPQAEHRDSCFRPAANDTEGSQNKADVSCVYKIGECMQELVKLWKEYELSQSEKTSDSPQNGPTLEIRIPAEHVTATNRQVRGGQLWGTDVYTVDSDLVAVLMHTGFCRPTASPPPSAIQELRATIRVLPPQECYISTLRNNVRSRAWGAAIGCSYRVEKCCILKKGGGVIDLEPCLTHSSTTEPTLAPVAVERTMTTRAAASNALRQQRFVREVTIQFNLCMEPWLKYSISTIADKGLKRSFFTSARLKKGEVLYVETHTRRYELCFNGEKVTKTSAAETGRTQTHSSHHSNGERSAADGDSTVVDLFRWSRCKRPLPQKFMQSIGIPLPLEHVEILEENLEWEDVSWSQTGVWIAGKEYKLARAHFLAPN